MPVKETKRDRALRMFREGHTFQEAADATSRPTANDAFLLYMPEAESKRVQLARQVNDLETRQYKLNKDIETLESKASKKQSEAASLDEKVSTLEAEAAELEERTSRLEEKLDQYKSKGVTDETFQALSKIVFKEGEEVLERINTLEEYKRLEAEKEELQQKLFELGEQISGKTYEYSLGIDSLREQERLLDEKKRENIVFDEHLALLNEIVEAGYPTSIIKSIKNALDAHGIQSDPELTGQRIADSISDYRELIQIRRELASATRELQETQANLATVKADLKTLQDNTVNAITQAREQAERDMNELKTKLVTDIEAVTQTLPELQEAFYHRQGSILDQKAKEAETNLKAVSSLWNLELHKTMDALNNSLQSYDAAARKQIKIIKNETEKWLQTHKNIIEDQEIYNLGLLFLAPDKSRQLLTKTPIWSILYLADFVRQWVKMMYPEARIHPTSETITIDPSFQPFLEYSLKGLAHLLCLGLDEIAAPSG